VSWMTLLNEEFDVQEVEAPEQNMIELGHGCPGGCRSPYWAKKQGTNGRWFIGMWCETCRRFIELSAYPKWGLRGIWANHEWVTKHVGPIDSLPIAAEYGPRYSYVCTMCGHIGAVEFHHWYPRGIYGWRVANRMPVASLCRECHDEASAAQREFCKRIMATAVKEARKTVEAFA
jgi:hypothetical protein